MSEKIISTAAWQSEYVTDRQSTHMWDYVLFWCVYFMFYFYIL